MSLFVLDNGKSTWFGVKTYGFDDACTLAKFVELVYNESNEAQMMKLR